MKRVVRRDQIDELVRVAVGEVDEERFSDLVARVASTAAVDEAPAADAEVIELEFFASGQSRRTTGSAGSRRSRTVLTIGAVAAVLALVAGTASALRRDARRQEMVVEALRQNKFPPGGLAPGPCEAVANDGAPTQVIVNTFSCVVDAEPPGLARYTVLFHDDRLTEEFTVMPIPSPEGTPCLELLEVFSEETEENVEVPGGADGSVDEVTAGPLTFSQASCSGQDLAVLATAPGTYIITYRILLCPPTGSQNKCVVADTSQPNRAIVLEAE